ncbi:MAG TPA: ATP-binding protein [Spirochaetota bacterium]|nr:ATP-binding protein [Spirochaetota bacterium]HOM10884.1 ATP-binding protein [Spirochaetota bacterium]HPP50752.1 ATP-binding protein [Spirochaetota bacterium]
MMSFPIKDYLKEYVSKKNIKNSLIFIGAFFIFATIIAFLLPPQSENTSVGEGFFVNLVMIVPLAAAVFFILISFRLRVHPEVIYSSSIRTKIALALIVIATVPTIPIIVITSNILNSTINQFFTEKTISALEKSVDLANQMVLEAEENLVQQLNQLKYDLNNHYVSTEYLLHPAFSQRYMYAKTSLIVTLVETKGVLQNNVTLLHAGNNNPDIVSNIVTFLQLAHIANITHCSRLSIFNNIYSVAYTQYGPYCIVMYRLIPKDMFATADFLNTAYSEYKKQEFLKPYFQTGIGIALILLSLGIILLAIILSIMISQSITRPVLELVEASEKIAKGDFQINLSRKEQDEIAALYESFNQMAKQLDHGRKMMYQTQKLQAWSDIARKLIHEIKNPLTPIRLSAERLYRRYEENHPEFPIIVKDATGTIIEEVNILMNMLSEFSKFARLPEINLAEENINTILENCIDIYGNDAISFVTNLDTNLPPVMCDKALVRQAFLNIIQNSIEAKTTEITITSIYDKEKQVIYILFKDNGVGIPEENLSKVFEPTFSTKESGMGLGLAIVEKIIIDHKWNITCDSKGDGTQFTITIPLQ